MNICNNAYKFICRNSPCFHLMPSDVLPAYEFQAEKLTFDPKIVWQDPLAKMHERIFSNSLM